MKTLVYISIMAIAAGLLIFALVNTNYNDPLTSDSWPHFNTNHARQDPLIFEAPINEVNDAPLQLGKPLEDIGPQISFLPKDQLGDFKFKLSSDQLSKLDCSVIGPGTETYVIINDELYVFECPEGYD